jgi:hypothetical protein
VKLRSGTYVREPDGATCLYHNETTGWNFPVASLRDSLHRHETSGSIHYWSLVTDEEEINELRDWLDGTHLKPGENVEIHAKELKQQNG